MLFIAPQPLLNRDIAHTEISLWSFYLAEYTLMGMKKSLAVIMMLIMLTPSLACAMPVCADKAQAAATEQPCAEHHAGHDTGSGKDSSSSPKGINFLIDCMGVDLQTADSASVQKPDIQAGPVFAAVINTDVPVIPAPVQSSEIRGPPPDWPALSQAQPSILLTTQRFRI